MNFFQAIASGFRNYISFNGRACRSEYWFWFLFVLVGVFVAASLDMLVLHDDEQSAVNTIFGVIILLPSIAVGIRRLHDIDFSGWWILPASTIVGIPFLIYWSCLKGTTGPNRFGPDPLGGA